MISRRNADRIMTKKEAKKESEKIRLQRENAITRHNIRQGGNITITELGNQIGWDMMKEMKMELKVI